MPQIADEVQYSLQELDIRPAEWSAPSDRLAGFPDNSLLERSRIEGQRRRWQESQAIIEGVRLSPARKATIFPVLSQLTGIFPETG